MAPTIHGENKKRPRMRNEQFKHTRPRTKTTTRLDESITNSATMATSINYGIRLKHQIVVSVDEEDSKKESTTWKNFPIGKTEVVTTDVISLEMDTDDEEVHSIISSQKSPKVPENLEIQNENEKVPSEPHLLILNSNNKNKNTSIPTDLKHVTVLNNDGSNVKTFSTGSISNLPKNDFRTYAGICEIKNAEGLLDIAIKTIKLIKRNQLLQRRLFQLQMETKEFIASVLANPENRYFRDKTQKQL